MRIDGIDGWIDGFMYPVSSSTRSNQPSSASPLNPNHRIRLSVCTWTLDSTFHKYCVHGRYGEKKQGKKKPKACLGKIIVQLKPSNASLSPSRPTTKLQDDDESNAADAITTSNKSSTNEIVGFDRDGEY